jgi:very-short-patch-repair endonuclease
VCCKKHHSDAQRNTPLDAAVAERAGKQWGVISREQLVALGAGRGAIERRVRTGRLHRLHRGVYAVGHRALRWEGHALAAVLACGSGAVLSHRSAARHLGLLQSDATRIEVSAPPTRRGAPEIRLHRSRVLDAAPTTTHDGIPVTTVARTLLDLAATVRPEQLERALAQAERLRLYDHRAVLAASDGHRGRARLLATSAREPRFTRNDFEARILALVREAGLPEPLTNTVLSAPDHSRLEVDLHWPAHRLIVEADGFETHGTRSAFEADRARDAALQAAGYRVLRFTWWTEEATILHRLSALL